MKAVAGKSRLSIGFYDDGGLLCTTVGKLCDLGVGADQLGIIAQAERFERLLQAVPQGPAREVVERLLGDIHPVAAPEFGNVVASRGAVRRLLDLCGSRLAPGSSTAHPSSVLRPDLGTHLRSGATALAISTASSEQQWASARILLEQSVFPVLTHEFRLPDHN